MQANLKTIGDLEVTVTKFGAMEAHILLVSKLGKVFLPVFSAFTEQDKEAEVGGLAVAVAAGLGQLNESEIEPLTLKLLSHCVVQCEIDGKQQRIDLNSKTKVNLIFDTRLPLLYKTILFVLETNYRGFLDAYGVSQ